MRKALPSLIVLLVFIFVLIAALPTQSISAQGGQCTDQTGKPIPCDTEKKKKPTVTDVPTSTMTPTHVPTFTPTLVEPYPYPGASPYPYPGGSGGGPIIALPWWWILLGSILVILLAGLFIPPLFRPRPWPGPGPDPGPLDGSNRFAKNFVPPPDPDKAGDNFEKF